MATRTLTIGLLEIRIKSADLAAQIIDTATASEFDVEVSHRYEPHEPAGREDDGLPVECEIKSIKACANVHFAGDVSDTIIRRGSDMLALFSGAQVAALEDRIIKTIESGRPDE
jgi:hypothetical protein